MNNFNLPPQLLQMLKGGNPQSVAMNMLQQNANNPMMQNLLNLANQGNGAGVETICRNILKSKGYDPDELMKEFQNKIG